MNHEQEVQTVFPKAIALTSVTVKYGDSEGGVKGKFRAAVVYNAACVWYPNGDDAPHVWEEDVIAVGRDKRDAWRKANRQRVDAPDTQGVVCTYADAKPSSDRCPCIGGLAPAPTEPVAWLGEVF